MLKDNSISRILSEFERIPKKDDPANIFSVAGYPHYENVCSNILAFFFHPQNEHGLGELFLSALMEVAQQDGLSTDNVQVRREISTENGGRIDLLIETDSHVIGIENKIFHFLANDLLDYSETIDGIAAIASSETIKIVLGLRKEKVSDGFISITYTELISKIREGLGRYATAASQKWLIYLIDFLNSIERVESGSVDMDLSEQDKFIIENNDEIEKLLNARNMLALKLNKALVQLMEMLKKPDNCTKQWLHNRNVLVHDFELHGSNVAFDLEVTPSGWKLLLFGRNSIGRATLSNCIKQASHNNNYKFDIKKPNRYLLDEFPLSIDLETISARLMYWFSEYDKFSKSLPV